MGINRNIEIAGNWLVAVFAAINSEKISNKDGIVKGNDKHNPLCEYILKTEGSKREYIATVNTRAAARSIKRELQRDKGIKVQITQYVYDSDRFNGGKIVSTKVVR